MTAEPAFTHEPRLNDADAVPVPLGAAAVSAPV